MDTTEENTLGELDEKEFAIGILNRKKILFKKITEAEFPDEKTGSKIFESKDITLVKTETDLFIKTTFTGQIKNSLMLIDGTIAFRQLKWPVFGKIAIQPFPAYFPKNPLPMDQLLTKQKKAENPTFPENPISKLVEFHQKMYGVSPNFSEPYPSKNQWCVTLKVGWRAEKFFGYGDNQKIARHQAAQDALSFYNES